MPTKYLDVDTIPDDFKVLNPSKLTKQMIIDLWCHWSGRAMAKLPILIFIKAQEQDLNRARFEMPPVDRKRMAYAYVDIGSDDEASGDELGGHIGKSKDGADESEGTSESSVRPPPSKRPRLSQQPSIPEEESSAANNNSNREKFLRSLSFDPSYKTLFDNVSALPVFVSFFIIYINLSNYFYI